MKWADAEFLMSCKGADMTEAEMREVGLYWRRRLRSLTTGAEGIASMLRHIREMDPDDSKDAPIVTMLRGHRRMIIEAATKLMAVAWLAEFRKDFENIAARAERLL